MPRMAGIFRPLASAGQAFDLAASSASFASFASFASCFFVHRRSPLRRIPSLPNMAAMKKQAQFEAESKAGALAVIPLATTSEVCAAPRLSSRGAQRRGTPLRLYGRTGPSVSRSTHFYSTMNPNRNRSISLITNGRCTSYSTMNPGRSRPHFPSPEPRAAC
jgi:hypothetical protein